MKCKSWLNKLSFDSIWLQNWITLRNRLRGSIKKLPGGHSQISGLPDYHAHKKYPIFSNSPPRRKKENNLFSLFYCLKLDLLFCLCCSRFEISIFWWNTCEKVQFHGYFGRVVTVGFLDTLLCYHKWIETKCIGKRSYQKIRHVKFDMKSLRTTKLVSTLVMDFCPRYTTTGYLFLIKILAKDFKQFT